MRRARIEDNPMPVELTARQREILDVFLQLWTRGRPPTIRELGEALGFRSTNGVAEVLAVLERKGWLRRAPSGSGRKGEYYSRLPTHHAMALLPCCPTCGRAWRWDGKAPEVAE